MGYDTHSWKVESKIAYLRRSMHGWEDMLQLYKALSIESKFQHISGHGPEVFNQDQIEEAITQLEGQKAKADLVTFLKDTLNAIQSDHLSYAVISFN